ncbi:AAA family ATPase [Burkholderia vietnamiensis]|uniref:AAA ATPase n=1 Tax=Burkholderia vietnamiensis (strain G4 / LMG 22486) TaxID=269482 RepID=A4JFN0_BURVG|nr:AAA ATPase [Burkholderia vietnamiensis G4]MCB4344844.1 AAA family ATPase [Burkholderia vietnamiensis]
MPPPERANAPGYGSGNAHSQEPSKAFDPHPGFVGANLTAAQAKKLLSGGCFPSCTPTLASSLVEWFGGRVFDRIFLNDPKAYEICGPRWEDLNRAVVEKHELLPLMNWMSELGANATTIGRAIEWAVDAENENAGEGPAVYFDAVLKDPHLLTEAPGIGFFKADDLALRAGVATASEQRQLACARAALTEACDNAGGGARLGDVEQKVCHFLGANGAMGAPEARGRAPTALHMARQKGLLKDATDEQGRPMVFSADFFDAEEQCAHILLRMAKDQSPYHALDRKQALADAQEITGLKLLEQQQQAVEVLFEGRVAIISGKPGAGKTTLLKCVAPILEKDGRAVHYAAPTGKAAKRMRQSIERPTSTIHRMLGLGRGGAKARPDDENPLKTASAVVIDEASMLDAKLTLAILRSIGPKTLLVLVGDPGQLPSIRAGKVLADLMDSNAFPTARLTNVVRQGAQSDIVKVARAIDSGESPDFTLHPDSPPERKKSDCVFLEEPNAQRLGDRIANMLRNAQVDAKMDPLRDAQVIAASNVGPTGAVALNATLQAAFNPPEPNKPELHVKRTVKGVDQSFALRFGDKVMQTSNEASKALFDGPSDRSKPLEEKGIFNGDVGYIVAMDRVSMWVQFDNGHAHFSNDEARKSLTLSYANTVHKFQGSESPLIFFAMHESTPKPLLTRNLAYTAITRARTKCIVIGSERRLNEAAGRDALATRHTRLKGLLSGAIAPVSAPKDVVAIFASKAVERALAPNAPGADAVRSTAPVAQSSAAPASASQVSHVVATEAIGQAANPVASQSRAGQATNAIASPDATQSERASAPSQPRASAADPVDDDAAFAAFAAYAGMGAGRGVRGMRA